MTCIATEIQDYHYTECGLDNVLIAGMPVVKDDDGDVIIDIPNINLLHAMIVLELAEKQGSWTALELKFVRSELGFTQSELGEIIDKDRQTVARWEKDEADIENNAEIVMRLMVLEYLISLDVLKKENEAPKQVPVRIMSERVKPGAANSQIVIQSTQDGYKRAAA